MTERGGRPDGQGVRPTGGAGPAGRARSPGSAKPPPSGLAWPTAGAYAVTPLPGLAAPPTVTRESDATVAVVSVARPSPHGVADVPLAAHAAAVTDEGHAGPAAQDLMQALAGTQGRAAVLDAPFAAMPETMPPPPFCPVLPAEEAPQPARGMLAGSLGRLLGRLTGGRARPAS